MIVSRRAVPRVCRRGWVVMSSLYVPLIDVVFHITLVRYQLCNELGGFVDGMLTGVRGWGPMWGCCVLEWGRERTSYHCV